MMISKIRIKSTINIYEPLIKLSWAVVLFGYFFQCPLGTKYASLIVPFVGLYIAFSTLQNNGYGIKADWVKVYMMFVTYLLGLGVISVFKGTELYNIIRFFLILAIIPLATTVQRNRFNFEFNIFILLAVIKCFVLFYFAVNMLQTGEYVEYRQWAYENHFGDIYINPVTHLPCVQVMGNAIIPMAAVLNDMYSEHKPVLKNIITFILALGTVSCGNSAFLICIALYIFYRLFVQLLSSHTSAAKKLFVMILLLILLVVFVIVSIAILEQKAGRSNAVRGAQAKILLSGNIVTGNGLANPIYGFAVDRTYTGTEVYFELQTLYVLNQIGLVGIFVFYSIMYSGVRKYGKSVIILLLIYLSYTFWNPYCFDTTEMITVILLINLNRSNIHIP